MHTMDQHLAELVDARLITRQAAEEKAQDIEVLKQLVHQIDPTDPSLGDLSLAEIDFNDSFSPGRR